jgi:acylphosphatase
MEDAMPDPADRAVHIRVEGRVQGVSYRAWTQAEARRLGLRGWVRNLPDGAVEARLEGSAEAVGSMLAALWRGPRLARVEAISVDESAPSGADGFTIR